MKPIEEQGVKNSESWSETQRKWQKNWGICALSKDKQMEPSATRTQQFYCNLMLDSKSLFNKSTWLPQETIDSTWKWSPNGCSRPDLGLGQQKAASWTVGKQKDAVRLVPQKWGVTGMWTSHTLLKSWNNSVRSLLAYLCWAFSKHAYIPVEMMLFSFLLYPSGNWDRDTSTLPNMGS
jgi:hypothetical protein